jgi:hypothetical protein
MADTTENKVRDRSFNDTPKTISTATWITVGVLLLIVLLGALMLGGFFGSASRGNGQPASTSSSTTNPK